MNSVIKPVVLLFALSALGGVQAATMNYQIRNLTTTVNSADYKASWASQTSAITSTTITDLNQPLGGNNTFSHLAIDFSTISSQQMSFQLAVDATYGGALYLDNALLSVNSTDLWWANNWNNTSEILSVMGKTLAVGNHTLDVYWAEACCNGTNGGRFSLNGGTSWSSLTASNLTALSPVPVPAAVWLFGSGLAGLMGFSRKKSTVAPLAA
jgi:hypothetical protein